MSNTTNEDNPLKAVAMVAMMGNIFCETIEDKNAWKLRMLKAGANGISVPDDWDSLPETEKERRLDAVIKLANE